MITISMWKVFKKAGLHGWLAIIPIISTYTMFKIAFGKGWLCLIPLLNFILMLVLPFRMAKAFGKSGGFGFGLLVLPIVLYPILAFGSAQYVGIEKK